MMHESDELARTLRSWFDAEAAPFAPRDLVEAVLIETRPLRPRRGALARLLGDRGTPRRVAGLPEAAAILVVLALLVLAALGATLAVGGPQRIVNDLVDPSAGVPEAAGAVIEIPRGMQPQLSVHDVERAVVEAMLRDAEGLRASPIIIHRVTYVPPNTPYPIGSPDAGGNPPGSMESEQPFWAVVADGPTVVCSSFCDASDRGVFTVNDDDSTDVPMFVSAGHRETSGVYLVPSRQVRDVLQDNGLIYEPDVAPADGIIDQAAFLASLDPGRFPPLAYRQGPVFGRIMVVDPAFAAKGNPYLVSSTRGASRPIWWIQLMAEPFSWAIVDAATGTLLAQGSSMGE